MYVSHTYNDDSPKRSPQCQNQTNYSNVGQCDIHGCYCKTLFYSRDLIFARPQQCIYSLDFIFVICHILFYHPYIRNNWRGFFFFLLGTLQDSTDLLAVLILLIWGTNWPTSVFECLPQNRPSLGIMPHSPSYFLGTEYISPYFAIHLLVYACVWWMLEGV